MNNSKMFYLFIICFLFSCNQQNVDPLVNNNNWQTVNINYQGTLTDIKFVSVDTGYTFGNDPNILLKTTDGGNSWEALPFPSSASDMFTSFYPITSKIILAGRYIPYRSMDGGRTWTKLSALDSTSIRQFEFTSATVGYACTGNGVYKTTDTGNSWRLVKQKSLAYDAIQFLDAQNGFISGGGLVEYNASKIIATYGFLARTKDGGETWINLDKGDWSTKTQNLKKITGMQFIDTNYGYLSTIENELLRTTDGGSTWEIINNDKDFVDSYAIPLFINKDTGFLRSGKTIFRTEDGGKTLKKDYYNEQQDILKLYSTPDNKIFAVGRDGLLLKRK
ncbi:WD40/YVTN/BNR-like repeat-containing protein [Adhaeribacter pallidiroseus]|uniref:Photosynthesis system II assembly factor Ycf48/Hcf136-like domain-containing protein n=1 Tax=Adhaeribacter pallidiroseus TaxID=2072847 RepID=A0A369QGT2_9BACT|nr:YCF48-related protein [Adhaeribacter pallidiroseus]RDC63934.1 hypothetical protein AHMF7616_02543 [Adhaeribacter pallidiroseus]